MSYTLHHGDALEVMRGMADNSVDAVVTDPPYFRVKNLPWDRQWDSASGFIAWIGELAAEWQRILKPNGSLYCFASPRMAARVEVAISERFNVLNHIVWNKLSDYAAGDQRATAYRARDHESFRKYFDYSERIIFAEHYGADNIAKGEAGYAAKCDELRGFVFEPLRAYLDGERIRAGFTPEDCNEACGHRREGGMAGRHYFSASQWCLPTRQNYEKLRDAFNASGGEYLRREYEDLRREYEDLRREYEDLRRPFAVSADVPYTDVWDFPTVQARKGKHPCEKPLAMLLHIIRSSTREGATVLDCFAGSGSTGEAALRLGRQFVGIEKDAHWIEQATARLDGLRDVAPVVNIHRPEKRRQDRAPVEQPVLFEACG